MTERGLPIVDGAPACPFVAFEDDRDERAASPDHRHRCYAEPTPAPRALAHQEAYCLSSAFPVCPTFQDWARREAARSRADRSRPEPAAEAPSEQPQRNPPRNWAAPPPWSSRGPGGATEGGLWDEDVADEPVEDEPPRRGRGLSGSYADRVAADTGATVPGMGPEPEDDDEVAAAAMGVAGGAAIAGASSAAGAAYDGGADADEPAATLIPPLRRRERENGYAAHGGQAEPRSGRAEAPAEPRHERRRDADAPEWERARPMEAYPTLRARSLPSLSLPPLLVAVVALALAAAVLFALPGLLGFGNPSAVATPSPSARPSIPASVAPTPVPQPTQQIYVVQSGDTMSRIAKKFDISLDDLIAANRDTIPDPDTLAIGDQVIIPAPLASEVPAAS